MKEIKSEQIHKKSQPKLLWLWLNYNSQESHRPCFPSVKAIVQFSLEVYSSLNLDSSTRHQSIQTILELAKYKFSSLKKHIPILEALCPIIIEVTNREEDDDDMAPDHATAAGVLNTMPLVLTKQGILELMKEKLGPNLQLVLRALRDPEQVVRGSCSSELGQFAEYVQSEIISPYENVLPVEKANGATEKTFPVGILSSVKDSGAVPTVGKDSIKNLSSNDEYVSDYTMVEENSGLEKLKKEDYDTLYIVDVFDEYVVGQVKLSEGKKLVSLLQLLKKG